MPNNEEIINLPKILDTSSLELFPVLIDEERALLKQASELYINYPEYALLAIWNAAVSNLKRRVEAYGIDLWISVVQDEVGRKKYDRNGDSINERWEGVDDIVLIAGSTKLGLLNKKAGKSIEMINWMRNHSSAAHETNEKVESSDVLVFAVLLQNNLFTIPLPDPGHSVSSLFDPVKNSSLSVEEIALLKDEINAFRTQDVRICFGFLLDIICSDQEPGVTNATELFPCVWARSNEDLHKTAGIKYHSLKFDTNDELKLQNKNSRDRLLNVLVKIDGVKYIPDAARSQLYRHAAKKLGEAKNSAYGWRDEEISAKTLAQFGPHVPSVSFEDVYQEILAVWCGNYWGRSDCYSILDIFIRELNFDQVKLILKMFQENSRVKEELSQSKPKERAIELLNNLKERLAIETQKEEVRKTIDFVRSIN